MTKDEFLKKLDKELSILNEKERKDIIDEYKDTIEEKVKHGQTEEEAVKDFGNLDELVSEILDAYKINPEYGQKESNIGKITEEGEKLIKKGASKLADMTRDFASNIKENDTERNLNLVFEIIIKIFCTFIILAILTIPFRIFKDLGFSFADTFFSPFSGLIKVIILLLFVALYLGAGLLIIIALFKQYFKKTTDDTKEDITEENNNTKVKESEKKDKTVKIIKKNGPTVGSVLLLIVKIWITLFILLPFFCIDLATIFGLFISIFYWIKGIDLFGLTLLLLGVSTLFIWFTMLIYNLTFSKGKTTIIPFFIGLIITAFGTMFFIDMITNIEYIDKAPNSFKTETETKSYTTDKDVYIDFRLGGEITKTIDETMPDNQFKIKLTYDKDSIKIDSYNDPNYNFSSTYCETLEDKHLCEKTYNYYSITYAYTGGYNSEKQRYKDFINNLKDNKIYDYTHLNDVSVEIIASSKTINHIETN